MGKNMIREIQSNPLSPPPQSPLSLGKSGRGSNGTKTKYYYTISEVCNITDLKPYVLRFWEAQFPQLHPRRRKRGNRRYASQDIENIKKIKYLLYEKGYTIKGAKKKLRSGADITEMKSQKIQYLAEDKLEILKDIQNKLRKIKEITERLRSEI